MRSCYKKEDLPKDIYEEFCLEMFRFRCDRKLTLDEVMVYTLVPVLEIDRLECAMADIDFRVIAKLLDLYQTRLGDYLSIFPGLKPEYHKYFVREKQLLCEPNKVN